MKLMTRQVKYGTQKYKIKKLVPYDFAEHGYWPFSCYLIKEDRKRVEIKEIKRDWKLKPKHMRDEEAKLENSVKQALMYGASLKNSKEYSETIKDETLKKYLLFEIYAYSYNLTVEEKLFSPIKMLCKDFAESLFIKSKAINCEPYALMKDVSKEPPELYNPKRFDFNWIILAAGWEKERKQAEAMQQQIRNRTRKR